MARSSSELASAIQKNEQIIQDRARALGCSSPSIKDGWDEALAADSAATAAQIEILNASHELNAVIKGPLQTLASPGLHHWTSLHCIMQLGLWSSIPVNDLDEGRTFEQVAMGSSTPVSVDIVKRIFRHATALFIFREEPKGVIRHTAASRYLAQNPDIRRWLDMHHEENWPSFLQLAPALLKWPDAVEPNQTAYQLAHNTELAMFPYLSTQPAREMRFAQIMAWGTKHPSFGVHHLVDGYPWQEIADGGKVVDMGGSTGSTCLAIAQKHPSITFVVQDSPEVIAKASISSSTNVTLVPHDIFSEQPICDADVYLLRQIIHDWSDHHAANILKNIVRVMRKGAVILIMDRIMTEPGELGPYSEVSSRGGDLTMLAVLNGKERDMEDYEKLLAEVDSRLEISRILKPEGSAMSMIEVRLRLE